MKTPATANDGHSCVIASFKYTGKAERIFMLDPKDGGEIALTPEGIIEVSSKQLAILAKQPGWKQLINSHVLQEIDMGAMSANQISTVPEDTAEAMIAMCDRPSNLQEYARHASTNHAQKLIVRRSEELIKELNKVRSLFPKTKDKSDSIETADELKTMIDGCTVKDKDFLMSLLSDRRVSVKSAAVTKLKELGLYENQDNA